MRIGLVVPHIFMHRDILPHVIFSPGMLALDLAKGLRKQGIEVILYTPGPVDTAVTNVTADLSYFKQELAGRGDSYLDLLKKHPFTFITLARQVQSELVAKAYQDANDDLLDVVHIYTNEEDIALPFAALCKKPVAFTHHDPFNFLVKYKNVFPKYKRLNWLSISDAQRRSMPADTNWLDTIYHGADGQSLYPETRTRRGYIACIGRIIESKGTHLAIAAVQRYNSQNQDRPLQLRLAGKHYAGKKDSYWLDRIKPEIDNQTIFYDKFISDDESKRQFLANADAIIVPSTFDEPFGMVMIEALACGTPVIGLDSGAIPEVVIDHQTGFVVPKSDNEDATIGSLAQAIENIGTIDRTNCRNDFEARFTTETMCRNHIDAYQKLLQNN